MSVPIEPLLIAAARAPHRWRLLRIAVRLLRHDPNASALLPTALDAVANDPSALSSALLLFSRAGYDAAIAEYVKAPPTALKQAVRIALAHARDSEDALAAQSRAKMPAADDATLSLPLDEDEIAVAQLVAGHEATVSLPVLIPLFENADNEIRADALRALRFQGAARADELWALLPGLSISARDAVVTVLAELRDPRIEQLLCDQFANNPMDAN